MVGAVTLAAAVTAAVAAAAAACGGAAPREPATAAPKGPTSCERTADHLVGLLVARRATAGGEDASPPETVDKITKVLIATCDATAWSAGAQACFGRADSLAAADACGTLLTEPQREALAAAIDAAFPSEPPP